MPTTRNHGRLGERKLELLGTARLHADGGVVRLERKTAGVLSYLAVEGRAAKYVLAGLLWPDSGEKGARANMRQLLHRLREIAGENLVAGQDILTLGEGVHADVLVLQQAHAEERTAEVLTLRGSLLGDHSYDDCPDFHDWLMGTRERLDGLRRRAFCAESAHLSSLGRWDQALRVAEQWVEMDPLSEMAWREKIRIHLATGDRAAALSAYERLTVLLRRELGVAPAPETRRLIDDATTHASRPTPGPTRGAAGPAALTKTVLHPPVLAGREAGWRFLEEGWQAGQFLLITGEGGVGKSRLLHDFAQSRGRGRVAAFEGRAGDASVPYASQTRALRRLLQELPIGRLDEWVRRELTRLVPELLQPGEEPPPLNSKTEQLRFYDAQTQLFLVGLEGFDVVTVDDVQYYDDASVEVAQYFIAKFFPFGRPGSLPRFIDAFRPAEVGPAFMAAVVQAEAAGLMRRLELQPLQTEAVADLLTGLGLAGLEQMHEHIARYTGGNPLYIVETVKYLLESGSLERGWPGNVPPPGRVAALIQRRLERLSSSARQLIFVAALAGTRFRLSLAADVLETPLLSLGNAMAEAEAALILREDRFTHDLVREAVTAAVPRPVRVALHQRLAECLTREHAPPAVIGHHWLAAEEFLRAVPFLVQAGRQDEAALRHLEAAELYARASDYLRSAGDLDSATRLRDDEERCRHLGTRGLPSH